MLVGETTHDWLFRGSGYQRPRIIKIKRNHTRGILRGVLTSVEVTEVKTPLYNDLLTERNENIA